MKIKLPAGIKDFIKKKGFDVKNVDDYDVVESGIENGYFLIVHHASTGALSRFRLDSRTYDWFCLIAK